MGHVPQCPIAGDAYHRTYLVISLIVLTDGKSVIVLCWIAAYSTNDTALLPVYARCNDRPLPWDRTK